MVWLTLHSGVKIFAFCVHIFWDGNSGLSGHLTISINFGIGIVDIIGRLIAFNPDNVNFELSLIFQVFEQVEDTIHGGQANDRRNIRRKFQRKLGRPILESRVATYQPHYEEAEGEIVEIPELNLDDTHPIQGKSQIEDTTQHTILNQLLDLQK